MLSPYVPIVTLFVLAAAFVLAGCCRGILCLHRQAGSAQQSGKRH